MKRIESAIEMLKKISGISAEISAPASDTPIGGIYIGKDSSGFTVNDGDNTVYISLPVTDTATVALAREYVLSALNAKTDVDPVRAFLEGGALPPSVRIGKNDYYVFAVHCTTRNKRVYEYLVAMAAPDDFVAIMSDTVTAFCKKTEEDNDYQSAGEFAIVLQENLSEEIEGKIKIGVGGVAHGTTELPLYYSHAKSALVGGAEFDPNSDIYSYKEYALIKVLSELPSSTKDRYVKTVLDRNFRAVLADEELMTAADAFIKHSLNISEASRSMYVHRNTLIYRIDKIEKITGLNIRNFNDAMTFRIAYLISKMI
ncbi:MAG: helix-turn-helix domain-containing protein [Clostridiales bacterium]|nr:helix-turn-helix domain-containing protein [Clostridiales bacterium]